MSMYTDIDLGKRGNKENCIANALRVTEYARRFPQGRWSFLGHGSEKKWYGTHPHKPDGEWDKKLLKAMCSTLPNAGVLCFVPPVLWKEENCKAQEKESNLFN